MTIYKIKTLQDFKGKELNGQKSKEKESNLAFINCFIHSDFDELCETLSKLNVKLDIIGCHIVYEKNRVVIFSETVVEIKEGSRLWAFKMLDEGKKVRQKSWQKDEHIKMNEHEALIEESGSSVGNIELPKDGWELYEDKPKKTMTLKEAIELSMKTQKIISFKVGNRHYKIDMDEENDNDDKWVTELNEYGYYDKLFLNEIIKNLDKQVEIIEEDKHE